MTKIILGWLLFVIPRHLYLSIMRHCRSWWYEGGRFSKYFVRIDGMGTYNRSKKFHDVCWKKLKDAGFLHTRQGT